ncbi:MAG: acetylornithine deacetylase, partial [Eudoraea sp.]
MKITKSNLKENALSLLQDLIAQPSFSKQEAKTAELIQNWFISYNIPFKRQDNNVYAFNKHFDSNKPTLLLNSHHDTVKPNSAYTKDPFTPIIEEGKLFGLGSNDAEGCLVSLIA